METIKKMLVVDDDEVFVFLTKKTIEQTHLVEKIEVFYNGLEALNFLKENKDNIELLPEMILLDLSMPIMDGWQFLEEFMKLNPIIGKKIMVYICSTSFLQNDIMRANKISAVSDYIIKPIAKETLVDILKNFVV